MPHRLASRDWQSFALRGGALFPPGKGGGEEDDYGGKGKGILIHTLTEGNGMPLANCTTAANGSEREQIVPLLDKVKLKTQRVRADRRLTTTLQALLAANLVDQRKESRSWLLTKVTTQKRNVLFYVNEVFDPKYQNEFGKQIKNRGRPIKNSVPRYQQERCFAWFQRKYRRLVVRWERQKVYFDAFINIATIHIWIQRILLVK